MAKIDIGKGEEEKEKMKNHCDCVVITGGLAVNAVYSSVTWY